ncbi:MAG TPA: murein biosynthesis integral membrane protein MurJ [Streptosporangiaceae bacterium]
MPGFGPVRRAESGYRRDQPFYPGDVPAAGAGGFTGELYSTGELYRYTELMEAEYARSRGGAPPRDRPPGQPGIGPDGAPSESLVRSSAVMAIGTLASRITGLIRSVVLVYALGVKGLGNAYNVANTVPNAVYNLAIGGILTSVIVPLLVSAAKRHRDGGEEYDQRMFTLVTLALAVVTLVGTVFGGQIASLYDPSAAGTQHHLLVLFAYFFIPQIFFYGVTSLASAILNARGHFAAPMWTPVVNNIVVTVISVAFMVIASGQNVNNVHTVTNGEVLLLGLGTTLGIVAQTIALIPYLHRVGFRWHPRFDFRRIEITEIGHMAGWMFGYVLTTQVAFLVTSIVANTAGNAKQTHGVGAGFSAYTNAWMLFQLPYAIVAISVITALLPRMSAHASDRQFDLVQADFSTGVRLSSVVVAPAGLVLAVLGPALGVLVLGWGATSDASARYIGLVFSIFSLGLMPYMLFQLLLRVFYALHDSKTPALIGVVTMITNVLANLIALAIFPKSEVVAALGAGFGLANLVGSVFAWRVLSRRIGGLAGPEIKTSLMRMHGAAIPAALFALIIAFVVGGAVSGGKLSSALVVVVGGGGALLIYLLFSRIMKVAEVTDLTAMVRSRLRR